MHAGAIPCRPCSLALRGYSMLASSNAPLFAVCDCLTLLTEHRGPAQQADVHHLCLGTDRSLCDKLY